MVVESQKIDDEYVLMFWEKTSNPLFLNEMWINKK